MNFTAIIDDINFLLGVDSTSYLIADKTRNINESLNNVMAGILEVDERWKFDSTNYTDLPIATTTLVSGQQDYEIISTQFLKVLGVKVLDTSGNYQELTPITEQELMDDSTIETQTAGLPTKYMKLGDSIMLYPTPVTGSVTLLAGLKVYYQRPPSAFTVADTTKIPGFNPLYHKILSYDAALEYAYSNNMGQKINTLLPRRTALFSSMQTAYARRASEKKSRMSVKVEDTR